MKHLTLLLLVVPHLLGIGCSSDFPPDAPGIKRGPSQVKLATERGVYLARLDAWHADVEKNVTGVVMILEPGLSYQATVGRRGMHPKEVSMVWTDTSGKALSRKHIIPARSVVLFKSTEAEPEVLTRNYDPELRLDPDKLRKYLLGLIEDR